MDVDRILKEVYHPVLPVLTYICHYHTVVLFQVLVLVGPFRKKKHNKTHKTPPRWFNVTFSFPSWRSLNHLKGVTFSPSPKRSRLESPGRWTFGVFWSSAPSGIDVSHTHRLHVAGVRPEEIQRQNAPEVDQIGPAVPIGSMGLVYSPTFGWFLWFGSQELLGGSSQGLQLSHGSLVSCQNTLWIMKVQKGFPHHKNEY